jgi:hypothetical protein
MASRVKSQRRNPFLPRARGLTFCGTEKFTLEVQDFPFRKVPGFASEKAKTGQPLSRSLAGEQGGSMPNTGQVTWQQTTRPSAKNACPHCGSARQHEAWCVTTNLAVRYAYAVVLSSSLLTPGDALILHSLGVIW